MTLTLDEAIQHCEEVAEENEKFCYKKGGKGGYFNEDTDWNNSKCAAEHRQLADWLRDYKRLLEQEPCEDAISRQAVLAIAWDSCLDLDSYEDTREFCDNIKALPSVNPQEKTGHCKDCKYFEYDSVAKVEGIPLIVAHEICSKWGDGCKTKEDGYCFLFEPQAESEE